MLFNINDEQQQLTNNLSQIIHNKIASGYIPFSEYMNLALYHPSYGYYNNLLHKFGYLGDYVTSPLISKLFASSLSCQISEIFAKGVKHSILEFGAGNGQLMLDILANIANNIDHYYIFEMSLSLAKLQQDRLIKEYPQFAHLVTWLSLLPSNFDGVIIANEVLDSIPCDVVSWQNGQIYSKMVTYKNDKFAFIDVIANKSIAECTINIKQEVSNYTSEVAPQRDGFIKSLSEILSRGVILLIDYGYGEADFYIPSRDSGTLRGFFRQHQLDDVLIYPGLIDITSSVNFTAIAKSAIANGLDLIGFTTQASFLINCGIIEQLKIHHTTISISEYLKLTNQLNRLISPNDMGEVFKVIAFSKQLDDVDYLGFSSGDRSYML